MEGRPRQALAVARAVYAEARAENLTFMAGSIAYHAFVSLLPFLVLLVALVSAVGQGRLTDGIVGVTEPYLTPVAQSVLEEALRDAAASTGLSAVGLATLGWGTMKIFRSLDQAFSNIYESEAANTLVDQLLDGTAVFVSLGLALLTAIVVGRAARSLGAVPFAGELKTVALILGLTVTFFPMYYLFPDEDVTAREVLPGTVLAAVGWTTLEYLFGIYTALSSQTETYGFIGAVLVIITWFYFSGLVLLVGAALNAVLAGRSEDTAAIDWELAHGPEEVDWESLRRALADLEAAASGAEGLTVTAGETTVRLPPPGALETETDSTTRPEELGGWSGEAALHARWDAATLRRAIDALEDAADGTTGGDDGEPVARAGEE